MRFVDAAEIRKVLTFPLLIDAIEAAHRRPKIAVLDGSLGSEREFYFARSALDRGRFMASKLITSFPANLDGGTLPAVQAVCVLFDGTNGKPLAVMDGTEITYWRTAADSAPGCWRHRRRRRCWSSAPVKCRDGWSARIAPQGRRCSEC